MLTLDRHPFIHRHFQATRDRQTPRAWRVEKHDKRGRQCRPTRQLSAVIGAHWLIETGWVVEKMLTGDDREVSALTSRIQ
ncbi:hypothetical protein, partial [Vreelandella titanicae]|uniref:hypothetical protein n=1 Tax=Vreelandella titanicae TaxID=664683 RepID=UPI0039BF33B4